MIHTGDTNRPTPPPKPNNVRHAPEGYGFVKGRGAMLLRGRPKAEMIEHAIGEELRRLDWPTHKMKVREFGRAFYLNIGFLRGLNPQTAYDELKKLPSRCGHKRILEVLKKLPERVESGAWAGLQGAL